MSLDLSATAKNLLSNLAISAASGDLKIIKVERAFDKLTGQVTGSTETEISVSGAALDYSTDQIDGTTVQQGDRRIVVDSSVLIESDDLVELMGRRFSIVSHQIKLSGNIPQVTFIQARGIV